MQFHLSVFNPQVDNGCLLYFLWLWIPRDFIDDNLDSLKPLPLLFVIAISHTDEAGAILAQKFLGASLAWL